MASKSITPVELAAQALALRDVGMSFAKAGEQTGLDATTVFNIEHGKHGWSEVKEYQSFRRLRALYKEELQRESLDLSKLSLANIRRRLQGNPDRIPLRDLSATYKVLRTEERLDAGEATEHIAVIHSSKELAQAVGELEAIASEIRRRGLTPVVDKDSAG